MLLYYAVLLQTLRKESRGIIPCYVIVIIIIIITICIMWGELCLLNVTIVSFMSILFRSCVLKFFVTAPIVC
jgi:hypothetical protein